MTARHVEGAVELAVAAAVQTVAVGVARRRRGSGRSLRCARACASDANRSSAGDLADELRGGQQPAAAFGEQLRRVAFDERGELCLELS